METLLASTIATFCHLATEINRQITSYSRDICVHPNMWPPRWLRLDLWAAGYPEQTEGQAECLGPARAWAWSMEITDVPPRQRITAHALLCGEVAGLEFHTGWAVIRPDRTACAMYARVDAQFHSKYGTFQRVDPSSFVFLVCSSL